MNLTPFQIDQQRHFDQHLEVYRKMYGSDSVFHTYMTTRLLELAAPQKNDRVLDLGCGFGRLSIPLLQRGCFVTGMDSSRQTLVDLQRKVDQLGLRQNFKSLGRPAEELNEISHYHLVVGRGILHHLEEPKAMLRKIWLALTPGGKVVFMDPNPLQPAWIPYIALHPTLFFRIERYVWRHTPHYNQKLLTSAGFKHVEIHFIGFFPPILWRWIRSLMRAERFLESTPLLRGLALYQIVRAER